MKYKFLIVPILIISLMPCSCKKFNPFENSKPTMEYVSGNEKDKIDIALKQKLGVYYNYFKGLENLQKNTGIQARLPFDMVIE